MLPPKDKKCHRTGFVRSCSNMVTKCGCELWKNVRGMNPVTGENMDRWGCIDGMLDLFLVDVVRQGAQTKAAMESLRNEMVALSAESLRQERIANTHRANLMDALSHSHTLQIEDQPEETRN